MATCSDCSANPGASTTARYLPSGKLGKVAVPSPAVVCTPTPALLLARNRLTCTPDTRSPDGLCTDTLRSDARAAVQHSSAASNARTMNMTLLLCTRKGLVTVRAGLLACELRFASRTAAGPSRLHSGLAPDSLTVARQRGFFTRFPVPLTPRSLLRAGFARNRVACGTRER